MKEPSEGVVVRDRIRQRNDQDFAGVGEDELQWSVFDGR
jgi:hypothetical protein